MSARIEIAGLVYEVDLVGFHLRWKAVDPGFERRRAASMRAVLQSSYGGDWRPDDYAPDPANLAAVHAAREFGGAVVELSESDDDYVPGRVY